jgi:hypothetical protein
MPYRKHSNTSTLVGKAVQRNLQDTGGRGEASTIVLEARSKNLAVMAHGDLYMIWYSYFGSPAPGWVAKLLI